MRGIALLGDSHQQTGNLLIARFQCGLEGSRIFTAQVGKPLFAFNPFHPVGQLHAFSLPPLTHVLAYLVVELGVNVLFLSGRENAVPHYVTFWIVGHVRVIASEVAARDGVSIP